MTSFLALRASVCAYLWCLIPSVCYIGFEWRPLSHLQRFHAGYLSASGRSPVRNLLDPYIVILFSPERAQFCSRCLLDSIQRSQAVAWCVVRFRHGKIYISRPSSPTPAAVAPSARGRGVRSGQVRTTSRPWWETLSEPHHTTRNPLRLLPWQAFRSPSLSSLTERATDGPGPASFMPPSTLASTLRPRVSRNYPLQTPKTCPRPHFPHRIRCPRLRMGLSGGACRRCRRCL